MALADRGYEPIPRFAEWLVTLGGEPDWTRLHDAVERLTRTRERIGPPNADLGARESLLLAALHTGAIEGVHRMNRGVTLTALDNVLDWQRYVEDAEGSDARRHVEAALAAYDLAIDASRSEAGPIAETWIRRVHEEAWAAQDTVTVRTAVGEQQQPLARGRYKTVPNHVLLNDGRMHLCAPPAAVPAEMHRLTEELRTSDFATAHPVVQSAYAHHALTQVHPFQDGNGRVARVLASVPLLRWTSVPFHLYEDQVAEYFDSLAAADDGDPAAFVDFVHERVHDLVLLTDDRLVADAPVEMPAERDRELAMGTARRVRDAVAAQLTAIVDEYDWPAGVIGSIASARGFAGTDVAGRRAVFERHFELIVELADGDRRAVRRFLTYVDTSLENRYPISIGLREKTMLELRLSDVHPEFRSSARVRLEAYLRRAVRETLEELPVGLGGT